MAAILAHREVAPLLSDDHFSVDGTLVKAWASIKSFQPRVGDTPPDDDPGSPPGPDAPAKTQPEPTEHETDPMPRQNRNAEVDFRGDLRQACGTRHVARKSRYSAIDRRTTRHRGYALSQKHRKRIEEAFGRARTAGGMVQTVYRGIERVRARFILTKAANKLARLPRLLAA